MRSINFKEDYNTLNKNWYVQKEKENFTLLNYY